MKDKEDKKIKKDKESVYQIGIIGTGRIAARFLIEARAVKEAEVTIVYNPKGRVHRSLVKSGMFKAQMT